MTKNEYNNAVAEFADDVYRFIYKNVQSKEDAKDIVQHAFEVLWTKCKDVEFEKSKSYLFTVAYRKMIDDYRKNKKTTLKDAIPEHLAGTVELSSNNIKKVIHEALNTLPDVQKQLVLLKDYEGYSYEEMASITGLQASQVKVYLFRARTALKKQLVSIYHHI